MLDGRRGVRLALVLDELPDGIPVSEHLPGQPEVDHGGRPVGAIVRLVEPPPAQDVHPQRAGEAVGGFVVVVTVFLPADLDVGSPGGAVIRPDECRRRRGDLREVAGDRDQPGDHGALKRPRTRPRDSRAGVRPGQVPGVGVHGDDPRVLPHVTERPPVVVHVVDGHGRDGAQNEERQQDLQRDECVGTPPVPHDSEQVTDHRKAPLRACTGCRRDMRQAG